MNERIPNFAKGDPLSAKGQNAPLPTVRSVQHINGSGIATVTQTEQGTAIYVPSQETYLRDWYGIITNKGPNGESDFTAESNPGVYWVKVCYIVSGLTADTIKLSKQSSPPNPNYDGTGAATPCFPTVVPACNLQEATAGSRTLATDGSVYVHVWENQDVQPFPCTRNVFEVAPGQAWIKLTSIIGPASLSSPNGGGGFYNARLVTGLPVTIAPTLDLEIPTNPAEKVPTTDNILAENSLEANLGNPPSHWVPLPSFVPAWYVGQSNETPPRPVYRFEYPNPGSSVTVKITGIRQVSGPPIAGGGRYNCRVLTGRAAGVDPDTDLDLPDTGETVPGSDNAIFENECETAFPNSHWIVIPSFIEARFVGYDNENPALPIYRAYIPSPDVPFVITAADGDAQYQVKTLTGASNETIGMAFVAPAGMTVAATWNAIACNLDEQSLSHNRLKVGSYGLGQVVGATPEGKGIIFFHGGVGRINSPKTLLIGTYAAPDTTAWNRDTDGTPVKVNQVVSVWGFDAASSKIWFNWRTLLTDARGMEFSWSAESQTTIDTSACSGSGSGGSSPSFTGGF